MRSREEVSAERERVRGKKFQIEKLLENDDNDNMLLLQCLHVYTIYNLLILFFYFTSKSIKELILFIMMMAMIHDTQTSLRFSFSVILSHKRGKSLRVNDFRGKSENEN